LLRDHPGGHARRVSHLAELTTELVLRPGYQYGDEFAFGIELVVDGLLASI